MPSKLKTFYTSRPNTSKVSLPLFARVSSQWAKCAVYFEYFEQFEVVFNKCHHTRLAGNGVPKLPPTIFNVLKNQTLKSHNNCDCNAKVIEKSSKTVFWNSLNSTIIGIAMPYPLFQNSIYGQHICEISSTAKRESWFLTALNTVDKCFRKLFQPVKQLL